MSGIINFNQYLERCVFVQVDRGGRITDLQVTSSPLVAERMMFSAARDPAVQDTAVYEWPGNWVEPVRTIEWLSERPKHFCFVDNKGTICEAPLSVR